MKTFLIITMLLFAGAASALDDVGASIISSEFSCRVGTEDPGTDTTVIVAKSVKLYRVDESSFGALCVDMPANVYDVRVSFALPYVEGKSPAMRAFAYSGPTCSGFQSLPSENACIVTHVLRSPALLSQ